MFISFDNILLMWLSGQPELQNKMGALWMGGFDESARILWKCSGMQWVYLHVLRCVSEREREKKMR